MICKYGAKVQRKNDMCKKIIKIEMKTLQNNFTTPEQSKQLLELGVPADSADCYRDDVSAVRQLPEGMNFTGFSKCVVYEPLPCWSVGRLTEILMICGNYFAPKEFKIEPNSMKPSLIENIVDKIEELEGYDMLDFSKLEE